MINRREWLLMAAGVPPLCCSSEEVPARSIRYEPGRIRIDLKQAGAVLRPGRAGKIVDVARGLNLIVARPEKNRYVALERKCTHNGGQVAYNGQRRTVMCTCWGHSEFALDGAVVGGPARRPLRVYETRVAGGLLEITL